MRFRMSLMLALVISFTVVSCSWADCEYVIANAKISRETVQSNTVVEAYARAFCSEYQSSKGGSGSASFGAAYKFLSLSFGQDSSSVERVASKYCDATNSNSARADAFREYVQTIAPGAFSAYETCKKLENGGLSISAPKDTILKLYLPVTVEFKTNVSTAQQTLSFAASPDVTCHWRSVKAGVVSNAVLKANTSDVLQCTRLSADAKSSVTVFATTQSSDSLSFSWDAYQGDLPLDALKHLAQSVDDSLRALKSSVVAFNSTRCPDGWREYTPAYGRFIRGIDNSKDVDPAGLRVPGNLQEDAVGKHKHDATLKQGAQPIPNPVSQSVFAASAGTWTGGEYNSGGLVKESGESETRPKNVALLYCERQ